MSDISEKGMKRRSFLKIGAAAGAAVAAMKLEAKPPLPAGEAFTQFRVPPIDPVRIGFVGVGNMGSAHVRNLMGIDGVEIRAVCDIVESKVERIQKWLTDDGRPKPDGYSRGPRDFERLCARDDLDLVYTATPWEWHVPVCVTAMKAGKHAATEVPAANTIEDCWRLVETAEKTKKHCVMMENCCYDRPELTVLNMVRQGVLGELIHGACGYLHDLRSVKFSSEAEGLWRLAHSIRRNGNLYPTHGLGPMAQWMNINRGDRFDVLVSMSSNSRGLNLYAAKKFGPDSPQARTRYALGDINTSLIQTRLGKTIVLTHDTDLPRPYSRINLIQGTAGVFQGYPSLIYLEERSPKPDMWEPLENYFAQYEHPLWKTLAAKGEGRGHGGMDFIEDYRLIQALRSGTPTDMDVYDAAAWSAPVELSERSVARRGRPQEFPDFTRGKWRTNPPLGIVTA